MLNAARKQNSSKINFHLLHADDIYKLNTMFDSIVFAHVLSTCPNPNCTLKAILEHLNPNGKLFILNHFSSNNKFTWAEELFQPVAKLFHFQSYFPLENLTALKPLKLVKACKFGLLHTHQLIVFEKPKNQ